MVGVVCRYQIETPVGRAGGGDLSEIMACCIEHRSIAGDINKEGKVEALI